MTIWAISDLHLAFGVPSKTMEAFGPAWKQYAERIAHAWKERIQADDLVLIPGDISWAMKLEQAMPDLCWIDQLPGTKLILRGNHDYWWSSAAKLEKALPPSIHFIHNNAFTWKDYTFGGTRLWDTAEYQFGKYIQFQENPLAKPQEIQPAEEEKIFVRELERLTISLKQLNSQARVRIALTHYPPIGADLLPSRASALLETFKIDHCVFGHLHNVRLGELPFGEARGVRYHFTSCDYLEFIPTRII